LFTAAAISILLIPYISGAAEDAGDLAVEIGEIIFYFAIAILIGVLVEREFRARKKQQEAQLQVERSQKLSLAGQIAAGVAHEVKNPLTTIKGAADILTDDATSRAERDEFKNILQNEIRRIDTTVSDFLRFARPRETRFEELNLTGLLETGLRQIENQARQRGLSMTTRLQQDVLVSGDTEKLHQMTLNLVLNAIQASKNGDEIEVTLSKQEGSARVEISDSGEGINDADVKRVFEPFFTTRTTGTGLGLAVVKAIVEAHGGEISFASKKDHGSTVTVTLPLSPE
jgi:signal transduction histidine kinase